MYKINSLNLEITNLCNLKCTICDIWKKKHWDFLELKNLDNLFSSKYINKDVNITITWWEPLLKINIIEIFEYINKLWFSINTISTNGTLYNNLEKLLFFCIKINTQLPNIHISIDWLETIHDLQRWKKWSFNKSIKTIIKLKKTFPNINIKIKYTITKNNIIDIEKTFILSKKLWVDILYKIVENDIFYTNKIKQPTLLLKNEKLEIIKILQKIYDKKNNYINNLIYYIKNSKLKFQCTSPENNLFIMANWETFCCTKYNSIWNLKNENIDYIIWNIIHNNIIKTIKQKNCNKCFSSHWSYKTIKNNEIY